MRRLVIILLGSAGIGGASAASAQRPVTRAEAIATALLHGPRVPVAAADTAAAHAMLIGARTLPNPVLTASYSKAVPQFHVAAELPLDFPWLRRARVASATAARDAARDRFALERAVITFDAETTYTNALVAAAHSQLSRRNALDADSLVLMAAARRDAGDASELDVQTATVFAGQQRNQATSDSTAVVAALLDLQTLMGQPAETPTIVLGDSLLLANDPSAGRDGGPPLAVTAAASALRAAEQSVIAERPSFFRSTAIQFGFEYRDPTGAETGILPTLGIAIPIPLLNHNQGGVLVAEAQRDRARAELELIRLESQRDITRMARSRDNFVARVGRDRAQLASANQVAAMSLTAYREGAAPLSSVLEAQRTARETLSQYINDLGAANDAIAALRMLTASAPPPRNP